MIINNIYVVDPIDGHLNILC